MSNEREAPPAEDIEPAPQPQTARGAKRRLFFSFGAQTVAILLRIIQQMVIVPVLIRGWGTELYSDWILLVSATGFLSMLDLGMQIYFGNTLLIAWSKNDVVAYRRQFAIAMGLYAGIIAAATGALVAASLFVSWPSLFGTHVMSTNATLWTSGLFAASTFVLIPFGVVTAIYRVHGDYGRGTMVSATAEALRGFGICLVVALGGTPITAAFTQLSVAAAFWLVVLFDRRHHYGESSLAIAVPKPNEVRETVARSSLYMVPTIATPIVLNSPVFLLGALGAWAAAIVSFSVSRTFTGFLRQIILQFCHPIGVELARQEAVGDFTRLKRLYVGGGRIVSGLAGILGGLTLVAAPQFLAIWTRGNIVYDPWLVTVFVATIILVTPAQVSNLMFQYNNRPAILVVSQGTYAAGSLILCFLLIGKFSAAGAAAGTGIAEFISIGLLLPYAASKRISVPLIPYLARCYLTSGAAFAISYGTALALYRLLANHTFLGLIELGITWTCVVALPSFYLLLGAEERRWVINGARVRLSRIRGSSRG